MKTLELTALQELLPHRYPFLLVDRIEVVEPGRHVIGFKRITAGEWWMEGVRPGVRPVPTMPHMLVLEALAQTSGALVRDLLTGTASARAYFMGATHVRLRAPAPAGHELTLDVSLLKWGRGICRARGVATVGGRTVVSAELTTVVRPG
ncbi:MAG: 3-hydroxyacyl-ACP dehydratase FabZ family protein [Gemmatimonadaceae bacterium]